MTIEQLVALVLNNGLGVGSFIVLILAIKRAGEFGEELLTNHLHELSENQKMSNTKLDKIIELLDRDGS